MTEPAPTWTTAPAMTPTYDDLTLRTFSFGGGVQSMAVLVLAAQGRVQYDSFLFSNVGDDSENPGTLEYYRTVAAPYAAANGISLIELRKTTHGQPVTLYQHLMGDNRSIKVPAYLSSGAPGSRNCTPYWKIDVIARWQRQHGASAASPAVVGLGISTDEIHRARTHSGIAWQMLEYPLIDLGMSRRDCVRVIEQAGLPVPPKSSCWFCPFKRTVEWQTMRREQPDLFDRAVALEQRINDKRQSLGKDAVYLHRSLHPLDQAIGIQLAFEYDDHCESGYCLT